MVNPNSDGRASDAGRHGQGSHSDREGPSFLLPATEKPAVTETDFYSWFIERAFNVEEQEQASRSDRHGSKLL